MCFVIYIIFIYISFRVLVTLLHNIISIKSKESFIKQTLHLLSKYVFFFIFGQ